MDFTNQTPAKDEFCTLTLSNLPVPPFSNPAGQCSTCYQESAL